MQLRSGFLFCFVLRSSGGEREIKLSASVFSFFFLFSSNFQSENFDGNHMFPGNFYMFPYVFRLTFVLLVLGHLL